MSDINSQRPPQNFFKLCRNVGRAHDKKCFSKLKRRQEARRQIEYRNDLKELGLL